MNAISYFRKRKGFTLEKLAREVGVQPNTVWRWEKGHSTPSVDTCRLIASALDCTIDELVENPPLAPAAGAKKTKPRPVMRNKRKVA